MLNEILTISGKPSLYKLLTRGRGALIAENIDETKKRFPIQGTDKVVSLGDISIFADVMVLKRFGVSLEDELLEQLVMVLIGKAMDLILGVLV